MDYRRVNARTLRAIYYVRRAEDVKSDAAGSIWLTFLDAVTGFNQVVNTQRAREMLAVIARSGQFLPVCLTFGPHNGPEDFAYVVDRTFSPGRTAARRYCREWLAYVDDLTVRTGRVLDGVFFTDAEYTERVAGAAHHPGARVGGQSPQEALEALGFSPEALGSETKMPKLPRAPKQASGGNPQVPKVKAKVVPAPKEKYDKVTADSNHPYAHIKHRSGSLRRSLLICMCVAWVCVSGAILTPRPRRYRGGRGGRVQPTGKPAAGRPRAQPRPPARAREAVGMPPPKWQERRTYTGGQGSQAPWRTEETEAERSSRELRDTWERGEANANTSLRTGPSTGKGRERLPAPFAAASGGRSANTRSDERAAEARMLREQGLRSAAHGGKGATSVEADRGRFPGPSSGRTPTMPWVAQQARVRAAAGEFDRMAEQARRHMPPPQATACFSSARQPGVVLRVSRSFAFVPLMASAYRLVRVAIPLSR